MGKATRSAPLAGSSRKWKRQQILPKPFGFCCVPEREPSKEESLDPLEKKRASPPPMSALSLGSIHECPALKMRLQETSKQRTWTAGPDGRRIESGDADPGGLLKDTMQSSIDLMIEMLRKQRQDEYEKQMDLWAELGEKQTNERKIRLKCEGRPYWYAEYSLEQLCLLKQLEDMLFKDKKQKSINRTKRSLEALGAINELKKVEPKVLAKLIREYSTEPIKFLCEIYKATTGVYPGEEDYDCTYDPSMRIIMSGIAFLELPDIIVELHKILPPVIKYPLPPKPVRPTLVYPKKAAAPLLQKLVFPVNLREYKQKVIDWEMKCREMRRPFVVLPKKNELEQLTEKQYGEAKLLENLTNSTDKKPDLPRKEEEKRLSKVSKASRASGTSKASKVSKISKTSKAEKENEDEEVDDEFEDEDEHFRQDEKEETYDKEDLRKQTESKYQMQQQIEWTTPPTPCPYKYRMLMNEQGPLKENQDFFAALRPTQPLRDFPEGRENLTVGLQSYLLEIEADMHPLQTQASQLVKEVGQLAREILESGPKCDCCCPCRETRRSHLIWHATQGPHNVIECIAADGRERKQVIGATALHTPASSLSSNSQPPCVPSTEKLVKDRVLGGFTIDEEGQPVRHIEAVSKVPEHVPHRLLVPDSNVEVIRNVPTCGCNERRKQLGQEPQTEIDLNALSKGKDEGLCYGAKFRPKEGPCYSCGANNPPDSPCPCCGDGYPVENADRCLCDDFISFADAESFEDYEDSVQSFFEEVDTSRVKRSLPICVPCGKKVYPCPGGPSESKMDEVCLCDSLTEFLQMDLCKVKCEMPPKEMYQYRSDNQSTKATNSESTRREEVPSDRRKSDAKRRTSNKKEAEKVTDSHGDKRSSIKQADSSKKNGENGNADKSEKNGKPRNSATVNRPENPGQLQTTEISENFEKPENSKTPGNPAKSQQPGKPERPETSRKSEKSEKPGNPGKSEKLEKLVKSEKPEKPKKTEKPRNPEKSNKTQMPEDSEPPPRCPDDTGPPYGERTKSEEALPEELTLAYLVNRHPPDFTSEQIPVREGGRPCKCRENRNNRKKLIFGIGNTTADDPASAVIEGVAWLTPVPSIRRSEEYIPEYELYDSPYAGKVCDKGKPVHKSPSDAEKIRKQRADRGKCVLKKESSRGEQEEELTETESLSSTQTEVIWDRSKDWNNAMADDYLTDHYAKKPCGVPCWKKCASEKEARRLKVMKPVCECRYERKIVKREEERRKWRERKKRLQALPKEEFLHLKDVAALPIDPDEEEEEPPPRCKCGPPPPTEEPVQVLEGVVMQTPCETPTRRRSCEFPNLPFKPDCGPEFPMNRKNEPIEPEPPPKEESQPLKKKKASPPKNKKRKSSSSKQGTTEERPVEQKLKSTEEKVDNDKAKLEITVPEITKAETPAIEQTSEMEVEVPKRKRRRTSFLDRLEEELMGTVRNSLAKLDNKDFISVKFPDYHKMPQLAYWIGYRVKGKNFTRKYKDFLLLQTIKLWESRRKNETPTLASSLQLSKKSREKLHFGYIRYWKQRIAKKKLAFYMGVRKKIVDLGRDEWLSMEFGKFPNVLFKQAYFTYMPTKERDTVAFRPWFPP